MARSKEGRQATFDEERERERERKREPGETGWFKSSPRSGEGGQGEKLEYEVRWSAESECLEPHITATRPS